MLQAFRYLLGPVESSVLRSLGLPTNACLPAGNKEAALSLLEPAASSRVDLATALECLPDDIPVQRVETYLRAKMEEGIARRNHQRVLRALMHAEHLQVQRKCTTYEYLCMY